MESTTVAALGRPGRLGDLYNAVSDSFVRGRNLFISGQGALSNFTTVTRTTHTDLKHVQGDSFDTKCELLNVSAELKLSALVGLLDLSVSGKYLNDRKRSSHVSSASAFYSIRTFVEMVNNLADPGLELLLSRGALSADATHVVVGVQYGANAMVTFESHSDDKTEHTCVEGQLAAELRKIKILASASASGALDCNNLELSRFHNLEFKVFGDILSDADLPQTPQQALDYMKSVPAKVRGENGGWGVPLEYYLMPIAEVRRCLHAGAGVTTQAQLLRSINESTIVRFVELFEEVAKLKQELVHLKEVDAEFGCCAPYTDRVRLIQLNDGLKFYEIELRTEVKSSILSARREGDSTLLENVLEKYVADPRSPHSTRQAVATVKQSLAEAAALQKRMTSEGIGVMGHWNFEDVMGKHQDYDVYVLRTHRDHRAGPDAADWVWNLKVLLQTRKEARERPGAVGCIFYLLDMSSTVDGRERCPRVEISKYRNGDLVVQDVASLVPKRPEHAALLRTLKEHKHLKTEKLELIMARVVRSNYTLYSPFVDKPQSIGYGVSISAPHMHAIMLELVAERLHAGGTALDIGSGSGYITACMGLMVGERGKVIGIDHIPELVGSAVENITRDQPQLLSGGTVKVFVADGRRGYPADGPYDVIHIGTPIPVPWVRKEILRQLKPGGRLVTPIRKHLRNTFSPDVYLEEQSPSPVFSLSQEQELIVVDEIGGRFKVTRDIDVRFSSWLTSKECQLTDDQCPVSSIKSHGHDITSCHSIT